MNLELLGLEKAASKKATQVIIMEFICTDDKYHIVIILDNG